MRNGSCITGNDVTGTRNKREKISAFFSRIPRCFFSGTPLDSRYGKIYHTVGTAHRTSLKRAIYNKILYHENECE
jgi:hypothetical protein